RCGPEGLASPVAGDARLAVMDDAAMLTIGQLADRTGLPVRTIRYWSDIGAVPPAARVGRDHRRYDAAGVARLELVATLRELGLGLAEIRGGRGQPATPGPVGRGPRGGGGGR